MKRVVRKKYIFTFLLFNHIVFPVEVMKLNKYYVMHLYSHVTLFLLPALYKMNEYKTVKFKKVILHITD